MKKLVLIIVMLAAVNLMAERVSFEFGWTKKHFKEMLSKAGTKYKERAGTISINSDDITVFFSTFKSLDCQEADFEFVNNRLTNAMFLIKSHNSSSSRQLSRKSSGDTDSLFDPVSSSSSNSNVSIDPDTYVSLMENVYNIKLKKSGLGRNITYTGKNDTYSIRVKPYKSFDKHSVTISIAAKLSEEMYVPVITGAFGIKLGDNFDSKNALNVIKDNGGDPSYQVKVPKTFRKFKEYYVTITPKSKKICSIWTAVGFSGADAANEFEIIKSMLTKKYKVKFKTQSLINGKIVAWELGDCSIVLSLESGPNPSVLMIYNDTNLQKQAKKEKLEIETQKSDVSAI